MSSAIYHDDTVELMARLMKERGIPVVYNSCKGRKGDNYVLGGSEAASKQNEFPIWPRIPADDCEKLCI